MAINISNVNNQPTVKVKLVKNDATKIQQVDVGRTVRVKLASKDSTKVQKVILGRPVRRVTESSGSLGGLDDVDTTGKVDGSVLVYNELSSRFEATLTLEKQFINGGRY